MILNVGTKKGTSVNELFNILKELTNYTLKPEHTERRTGDIDRMILDNEKMIRELNYAPKTAINKGLELTVQIV